MRYGFRARIFSISPSFAVDCTRNTIQFI
jgi:hypothetical protein